MARNGHGLGVAELARQKWHSSGISDETAKKLRLTPVADASKLAANLSALPALQLPYFDFSGRPTKFYRVRYLVEPAGFAGAVAKPQRYAQPTGTLNEVYMPPLLRAPWREIAADPTAQLLITEGELKAACACAWGAACLGLGGVDVWRSSRRQLTLLPQLEEIVWRDRRVVIVFDSDASTNPNVVRAQLALARELTVRGAHPVVASLPPQADGSKQGLDDFLVAGGDLDEVISEAAGLDEADALWKLNSEVAYIVDPGIIVRLEAGKLVSPGAFKDHAYSHRHFWFTELARDGSTHLKKKPLAPRWLSWECRHELERLTYAPGLPRITETREFNRWRGWGCEPKKGDVTPWLKLLDFLLGAAAPAERAWFERWWAYPVQHPGTKLLSSVVMWGVTQGTGKSLVGYSVGSIYGENFQEIKEKDLRGGFNSWSQDKQLIMGDDVTGSDSRQYADMLKSLITQKRNTINAKYLSEYTVPDCINYYFTSQHPDAFFVEDTDRRYFIWEAPLTPLPPDFYRAYDTWLSSPEGPSALFYHLLHLPLGDFDPNGHALSTAAKRSMIADSKSDVGAWVLRLREDPSSALVPLGERVSREASLLTNAQLLRCYDPEGVTRVTANGMGRELKRAGFRQANQGKLVKLPHGPDRVYAVRDTERWLKASPQACADHWTGLFGPRPAKL